VPLLFLAHDAFIRTNYRTIAMIFVCPSVHLGWACIVINWSYRAH